jgi:CRISPR/Cas system-associated protein Csm6
MVKQKSKTKLKPEPVVVASDESILAMLDELNALEESRQLSEEIANEQLEQLAVSMGESRRKELARREEVRKQRLEREKAAKAEKGVRIAILEPHQNPQEGPQDALGAAKGGSGGSLPHPRKRR